MNPFRSSNPNLSSSDRTRDKKSKYIYAAAKQKFQKNPQYCNGKNIKYYKKGMVRSVANYKLQQDLARGNVLCEDCNDRGTLVWHLSMRDLTSIKVEMENNQVYLNFGVVVHLAAAVAIRPGSFEQGNPGFPVIQSDISGVWDPSTANVIYKGNICPDGSPTGIPMPYGYLNNLIRYT